jgi:hypothetical protein
MALTKIKRSGIFANTITTYDVSEVPGSNQYFTNARVEANVIQLLPGLAGDNIAIAANGRISSTATGGGEGFAAFFLAGM